MITNGFTYVAVLLFLAGVLLTLEKTAKGAWKTFFKYVPSVVLCYLIAMLLCTFKAWDLGETTAAYGALCGSWIGGSGNMVAVQAALNIAEADMGYALVIDSIDYSLWVMFLLWAVQLAPRFNQWTKADTARLNEVSTQLEDEAKLNTKPVTLQSLLFLIGCAFLVSAIATNMGAKLYDLTGFSDKSTWTVLFVTAVALVCAVTPLGKTAGANEVSNLLLYAVIGLLASRASLLELGDAPAWILCRIAGACRYSDGADGVCGGDAAGNALCEYHENARVILTPSPSMATA